MTNLFEQATRKALRFESTKGNLTVEDLWNLPLQSKRGPSLDQLAIKYNDELQKEPRLSFVSENTVSSSDNEARFEILKHIIDVRKQENTVKNNANAVRKQNEKILAIIASKQDQALENLSIEELQAKISSTV